MKFSKFNNPNKRRRRNGSAHSKEYKQELFKQLCEVTAGMDQKQKQLVIEAFNISAF